MESMEQQIEQVAELVVKSERIIFFTGAGHSTESGIPDFRGPDGIWSKYDPENFTIDRFHPMTCCPKLARRGGFPWKAFSHWNNMHLGPH